GEVGAAHHREHAGDALRRLGVHSNHAGMRMWAGDEPCGEAAGNLRVERVIDGARHSLTSVDHVNGLSEGHAHLPRAQRPRKYSSRPVRQWSPRMSTARTTKVGGVEPPLLLQHGSEL